MIKSCIKWFVTQLIISKKGLLVTGIMMLLVAMNVGYLIGGFDELSGGDIMVYTFMGYGLGYLSIMHYIFLLLFNNIPLYYLCMFLSESSMKNSHLLVRMKNPRGWFLGIQCSYLIYLSIYYILSFVITVIIACCVSPNSINVVQLFADDINVFDNLWVDIFCTIILKIAECMFIEMLFLVIAVNIKNINIAFFSAIAPYGLLIFNIWSYFPYGLSSLLRQNSNSVFLSFIMLIGLYLLFMLYFWFFGYKKMDSVTN